MLVRQRTQKINTLRGHLAEFGIIAPQGPAHIGRLAAQVNASDESLPEPVRVFCWILRDEIKALADRIAELNTEIKGRARQDKTARRLMTIPGIGPVCAAALEALATPVDVFKTGRDFAAWMGLTPREHSTDGKPRLGKTSTMIMHGDEKSDEGGVPLKRPNKGR